MSNKQQRGSLNRVGSEIRGEIGLMPSSLQFIQFQFFRESRSGCARNASLASTGLTHEWIERSVLGLVT